LERRVIVLYDSLNTAVPASVVKQVCAIVKQVHPLVDGFTVSSVCLPKQSNSTDCGASLLRGFTYVNANFISLSGVYALLFSCAFLEGGNAVERLGYLRPEQLPYARVWCLANILSHCVKA
jgi:hypothetical protein